MLIFVRSRYQHLAAVHKVDALVHMQILVALYHIGKYHSALEVEDLHLSSLGSNQTNVARSYIVVEGRCLCGRVGASCMLVSLVNAYPVKLGFVGEVQIRRSCPTTITYALVENEVEGLVKRPLSFNLVLVGKVSLAGVREHLLAIELPSEQVLGPYQAKYVVFAQCGGRVAGLCRVVALSHTFCTILSAVSPLSVDSVVSLSLGVNLFPNVNLAAVRPATVSRVVRHHPESGEVTSVTNGHKAAFNLAVSEFNLVRRFNGAANHLLFVAIAVLFAVVRILQAAQYKFAVFNPASLFLAGFGLCTEALPCGIFPA